MFALIEKNCAVRKKEVNYWIHYFSTPKCLSLCAELLRGFIAATAQRHRDSCPEEASLPLFPHNLFPSTTTVSVNLSLRLLLFHIFTTFPMLSSNSMHHWVFRLGWWNRKITFVYDLGLLLFLRLCGCYA